MNKKMYYIEFISKFLGLGTDATIERIFLEVAVEVDDFIDIIIKCSDMLFIYSVVSYFILLNKLAGFINKLGLFF